MKKCFSKLNEKETDLFMSIVNTLIEKMPQDEYNFDDHGIWYGEDGVIEAPYDTLEDTLEWVLGEVIPYVCKTPTKKVQFMVTETCTKTFETEVPEDIEEDDLVDYLHEQCNQGKFSATEDCDSYNREIYNAKVMED